MVPVSKVTWIWKFKHLDFNCCGYGWHRSRFADLITTRFLRLKIKFQGLFYIAQRHCIFVSRLRCAGAISVWTASGFPLWLFSMSSTDVKLPTSSSKGFFAVSNLRHIQPCRLDISPPCGPSFSLLFVWVLPVLPHYCNLQGF